jgi:hypothetical protein
VKFRRGSHEKGSARRTVPGLAVQAQLEKSIGPREQAQLVRVALQHRTHVPMQRPKFGVSKHLGA